MIFGKKNSKSSQKASVKKNNRHFVLIEVTADLIFPEIVLWGEAIWWPPKSSMKFTRLTPGAIQVGTKYQQKVLLPLAPKWEAQVTNLIPGRLIERIFLNGIFRGKETVIIEERYDGMKVDYLMEYEILGLFNKMMWGMHFQKLHDKNIEMILKALKEHVLKKKNEVLKGRSQ